MEKIESNNYYLVAKGGLGGIADTWIKINGNVLITVKDGMPLHIEANNDLEFEGFGDRVSLSKDPFKYLENYIRKDEFQNTIYNESSIDFSKYVKLADYVTEYRDYYYNLYKSFIKNIPNGEPTVRLEFPSNSITYGDVTRFYSIVQLFDEQDRLIIESNGEGAIAGEKPSGNNHGAYFMIPEGNYRVVISNNSNNREGDRNYIIGEIFRQDELSPSGYYDFGNPQKLNDGEHVEYIFSTNGVSSKPSGLIKINNVSR